MTRVLKVLQHAHDCGDVRTADVVRLFNTNLHDAARLLREMRDDELLEAVPVRGRHGRVLSNRLTDQGRAQLCGRICTPPHSHADFGPLLAAFGR